MNLTHIRYFMELAKTLNFTETSKNLYISQPGLSQQIHSLEKTLGVKLFNRTTRKVELTEEGQYLLDELTPPYNQIENTISDVLIAKSLPSIIKIATIPSAASLYLPKVLKKVRTDLSKTEFNIKETTSAEIIQLIKNKEYHIGFIRTPIKDFDPIISHNVQYIEFNRFPIKVVVSSRHRLASKEKVRLNDLSQDVFLHYDPVQSPALYQLVNDTCNKFGFSPKIICRGLELLTRSHMVSNNLGITMMPADMFQLIESPRIKALEIEDVDLKSSVFAVWENTPYLPLNTKYMVELLRELKDDLQL